MLLTVLQSQYLVTGDGLLHVDHHHLYQVDMVIVGDLYMMVTISQVVDMVQQSLQQIQEQ